MKRAIRETVIILLLAAVFFLAIRSVVHNFEVNGQSMEPNLHHGQFIIVSKAAYWFGDPQRGDIVVFSREKESTRVIHRIVGMPGETIEIKGGELFVNGERWDEQYTQGVATRAGPVLVPEDHYFIVGDNRRASSYDTVRRSDIVGKAWLCYWPFSDFGLVKNHSWDRDPPDTEEEADIELPVDVVLTQ